MSSQLAIDGTESEPEPIILEGFCKCGCGERVEGRMQYKDSHRQRAYRRRVKAEMERVGLPALPSLRAAGVSRPTQDRNGDAQSGQNGPQRTRSGLQVSYRKAAAQVAAIFVSQGEPADDALSLAEHMLAPALSPRQREVLDQRQRRNQ